MSVGLVIVSHSAQLAAGVVELAAQMAPTVVLVAAGGMDDGGMGTSLERVMAGLEQANTGEGVVILTDLGSAVMTAESALEFLDSPESLRLAHAPLVEGAVAAAVAAQSGGALDAVCAAAESAFQPRRAISSGARTAEETADRDVNGVGAPAGAVTATLILRNPMGLHARPAAALASALSALDADIEVNGVDGQSVMLLMTLGAGQGSELRVSATGAEAQLAVDLIRGEVEAGFGEM